MPTKSNESPSQAIQLATFFRTIYGQVNEGIICVASKRLDDPSAKGLRETYFHWPNQQVELVGFITGRTQTHHLWYCPHILSTNRRIKSNVIHCPTIWADLDYCLPGNLLVTPSIVIQSSEDRYQALWRLGEDLPPTEAENISKRIAYYHAEEAKDKSGWDLTQLLRVPYTYNFKYGGMGLAPRIEILAAVPTTFTADSFDLYPKVEYNNVAESIGEMPTQRPSAQDVLMKYRSKLHPLTFIQFSQTPKEKTWSESLWNLQCLLFEGGLTPTEVFAVCLESACNKFDRDERGPQELWLDIGRSYAKFEQEATEQYGYTTRTSAADRLLTDTERSMIESQPTIVEDYINWAKSTVDSPPQYHIAGAFIILSALLAGNIRLQASFGTIKPNLWFMILADTTLTRKTTSMDRAMDFLEEINSDVVLATEGSIEGIFAQMAMRPGLPSIFLRDEFSGLLQGMAKKDYMAGMGEMLTKLYDGKMLKRVLATKTIDIKNPCFIMFTGGIKKRIFSLLSYDDVVSGFLPRFLFVTGQSDVSKLKPVGPPTHENVFVRDKLMERFRSIYEHYDAGRIRVTMGEQTKTIKKLWDVELTPEAWAIFNRYDAQMLSQATNHSKREILLPSLVRLSHSGLKAAMLIAASKRLDDKIVVTEYDITHAFYYVEKWRDYLMEVLMNIGKTAYESQLDAILQALKQAGPDGMKKGELMRNYQLNAKNVEEILQTLHGRYQIQRNAPSTRSETIVLVPDPEDTK